MNEDIIKAITKIATAKLQKKHPELKIKEWQTKYVLEAVELFRNEWEQLQKNTTGTDRASVPKRRATE